jgi:hypothetical protein
MRCRDRFGLGATIAFELGPGVSEAVLIGSSQLPHVVALPLNRRLNLVADFENLLLGLAPSPRLAGGYRKSLANDEQIAFSIQITCATPEPIERYRFGAQAQVAKMQHRAAFFRFTPQAQRSDNSRWPSACVLWIAGNTPGARSTNRAFLLDVARMSRANTNNYLDEYEQDVDEIVAACNGDLRGAVKALMLVNEQLEQKLGRISAELVEHRDQHHPRQKLLN